MNNFLEQVGVTDIFELFQVEGRLYFAANLVQVSILDRIKGTNFGGRLSQNEIGTRKERANDYSASPCCLIKTLKKLYIEKGDTVMDLGCGKGLGMYYMSKFPFKKLVELNFQGFLLMMLKVT